jgi:hypothetical protein
VATVDAAGRVVAKKKGKTTVTIKVAGHGKIRKHLKVT